MTPTVLSFRPHLLSTFALLAVGFASGCGEDPERLQSGEYVPAASMSGTGIEETWLSVDVERGRAVLGAHDTETELRLIGLASSRWREECPTQMGSVTVETFDVDPPVVSLGEVSLVDVQLTAGCSPAEAVVRGRREGGDERVLVFTRR